MSGRPKLRIGLYIGVICVLFGAAPWITLSSFQDVALDLGSIPLDEWWEAGESAEIEWKIDIDDAELRHDQRFETKFSAAIRGKDLGTSSQRDLFLISRVRSLDGTWLSEPVVTHDPAGGLAPQKPEGQAGEISFRPDVTFEMRAFIRPGDYELDMILYDRETGQHNMAVRPLRINELRNDPLPEVSKLQPAAELMEAKPVSPVIDDPLAEVFLPVRNTKPVDLEVISPFNPPEHWANNGPMQRVHTDQTIGTLAALLQTGLAAGSIAITGLDLIERNIVFEKKHFERADWPALTEAFRSADSPAVSAAALQGRKENATFFRQFMEERLASSAALDDGRTRVFVIVSSSIVFERGSDLSSARFAGNCRCRIYHIRLQVPPQVVRYTIVRDDVFDELGRVIRSLPIKTYRVMTPIELRKALAEIFKDLEGL